MVRSLLPRIPLMRAFAPRIAPPILPIVRLRPLVASSTRSRLFHHSPTRLTLREPNSPRLDELPPPSLPPEATLSQRLKHLIKSYGWYALGVYLIIGAIDFCVAFAGINLLGAEYVSEVATNVKQMIAGVLNSHPPEPGRDEMDNSGTRPGQGGHEGLYAMAVLAYTIHKTLFLPVRVGFTAAFTPKLVGWLRSRGYGGGAGAMRAATEMRERIRERRGRSN
ncbi:hypothetical protein H0H87_007091 [Tephrocybe sp. NHM501043]|nr:hypothetical protein H0H87_007091 [Tephrocybe sp. NHM501043]